MATADERRAALIARAVASDSAHEALLGHLLAGLDMLRSDLARREDRRMKEQGTHPAHQRNAAPAPSGSVQAPCFPSYGRAKGQPIAGATLADLSYYRAGADVIRTARAHLDAQGDCEAEAATWKALDAALARLDGSAP